MVWRRPSRRGPVFEPGNGWIHFCEFVFYPLTRILGRWELTGLENIAVPGPVLLVANHISHIDPIFDSVGIRKSGRWPHIMAKASLWKLPVAGWAMRGSQQIPVDRGGGKGQIGLRAAIDALADGKVVMIYPDGTVTRDPDMWPMRPRPGVASLALSGDFPVIPMVKWGTHNVYRSYTKHGFRPFPRKKIIIKFGEPLDLSEFRGRPADSRLLRDCSYAIMTAVTGLLAEIRGEAPPETFFDPKKAERQAAASSGS